MHIKEEYNVEEQRYNVGQCTVWQSRDIMYDNVQNGRVEYNVRQYSVWKSRDRMYDSVQYGRLWIECKTVYSMDEQGWNVRQCTIWNGSYIIQDSVHYGRVGI